MNSLPKIKIIKMNQREIPELKNSVNEMKTTIKSIWSEIEQIEGRISDLEDRNLEITSEQRKGIKRAKKAWVI